MKALRVHGGGALLESMSCRVGLLAAASMAMLVGREAGREADMADVVLREPSQSSADGGRGDCSRGLGDGLR